jgi:hypothetical protein
MKTKIALMLALALMMSLTVGSAAFAKGGINNVTTDKKIVRTIALNPTADAPADAQLSGKVRVRSMIDGGQDFTATIEAVDPVTELPTLPAGTAFDVVVNGNIDAGQAVVDNLGDATLELINDPADLEPGAQLMPADFPNVLTIKTVDVYDANGTLVLTGSF